MRTHYRFEWGMSSVLGLPLAVSYLPDNGEGFKSVALHIGPLLLSFEWREI